MLQDVSKKIDILIDSDKDHIKSYIRLSEIQAKANESSSEKNSIDKNKKNKSSSNKSMNRLNDNIRLLKFS